MRIQDFGRIIYVATETTKNNVRDHVEEERVNQVLNSSRDEE
jgi:hypothetical protein